jgi:hypothetical protein
MRRLAASLLFIVTIAGCSQEPSLSDEEERFVDITLALMRARANVAQINDTNQLNQSQRLRVAIDSVYKRFEIDSVEYHKLSVALADKPSHALLAHQAIKDSLGIK